ncbi:hypothetical protein BCR33DRAFT_783721 [Rhizoclosmatium globosum]|uniref:Receptor ligand binding region domain-containing protein n=1 Tax=Rhizoclosmatium globosum TaxID=329046 RepID=A0A1Y2CHS5_9FUNG|nr:hypothetical protein BCR33DRAFT_783721 [Rhizoclosmatium globosum]|eukprot:ORY46603.1 hypothetical protein BCR33DRAFT_783721 [Rhizoclosmatium globosum]
MLSSKTGATVTVAIIGPYNWNCDSWWYWNQKAIEIAVKNINNSPLILPNVTIEIKRFNDNDKPVCFENPGYAIATAYDIVTNFPDVIGVMGDLGSLETLADAEVYGLNDIPICTGSEYHQRFWKSSNYPTYFQMFGYTGFAESIALL